MSYAKQTLYKRTTIRRKANGSRKVRRRKKRK